MQKSFDELVEYLTDLEDRARSRGKKLQFTIKQADSGASKSQSIGDSSGLRKQQLFNRPNRKE